MTLPQLDESDNLVKRIDVDLNSIFSELSSLQATDPIVPQSTVAEVEAMLNLGLPLSGRDIHSLVQDTRKLFEKHTRRNTHPGFFGYIASCGLMTDPLANILIAAINQNVVGFPGAPAAATIERTVVRWLATLAGFTGDSDGVLLGGGSIANMTAIGTALTQRFGSEYRLQGITSISQGLQPKIICSQATHFSIQRAAGFLGIGTKNVISLDVDDNFRMQPDALRQTLENQDCAICVIASAGTTTHGAIDPLAEIAEICRDYQVWFHVDAAYGGAALMSPPLRHRLEGIQQADSITMDLHKWFYIGFEGSVLLYRNPEIARQMFFEQSDYVQFPVDGPPEQHMFFHLSPELSRRFRALPAYLAFTHYGFDRLGRNVLHNTECAQFLASRVIDEDELQLVVEPQLSIVCFRYNGQNLDDKSIDRINRIIRQVIEQEGQFFMSPTDIAGRPVLRVCIVNHATRAHHLQSLVDRVLEIGRESLGH